MEELRISPFVQLVKEDSDLLGERTMLDGYLQTELDNLILNGDKNDSNLWKTAKEQLGQKLIVRDIELNYYRNKSLLSTAVNVVLGVGIVGLYFIRK